MSRYVMYALDEHAVSTLERLIHEREGSREALCNKISLAVRPVQLQIVHSRPSAGQMSGAICRLLIGRFSDSRVQVGSGHERTKGLSGLVKVGLNFFCYVQDRLDAAFPETSPISNVVLRTKPYPRQNLYRSVGVRHSR